jgi:hypothetical protein
MDKDLLKHFHQEAVKDLTKDIKAFIEVFSVKQLEELNTIILTEIEKRNNQLFK